MEEKRKKLIEKYQKTSEIKSLLHSNYETIDLRGAVLIDGHHLFLNIIRGIQRFNRNPNEFLARFYPAREGMDSLITTIKESRLATFDSRRVARVYGECVVRIANYANETIKQDVFSDDREFLPDYKLSPSILESDKDILSLDVGGYVKDFLDKYPPNKYLVIKSNEQRWVFDALMPDKRDVEEKLNINFDYWSQKDRNRANNLKSVIELLKHDQWGFFENQVRGSIVVPFSLKNEVLKALGEKDWIWGNFNLQTQIRQINGFSGFVESREKGVDTKLVIKGCELAAASDIDWVWLVTADGDHAPLVEHLRESGKEVFLTSVSYPSNALVSALSGPNRYVHFDQLFDLTEMIESLAKFNSGKPLSNMNSGIGVDYQIIFGSMEDHFYRTAALDGLKFPDEMF